MHIIMKNITIISLVIATIFCTSVDCKPLSQVEYADVLVTFDDGNSCTCTGYECSCCVELDIERIHLKDTACIIAKYLPDEIGIDMQLVLNNKTIISEKVSLRNPPPLCVGIPHFHQYASLCVALYNVTWSGNVGACLKLEAKLAGLIIEDVDIGCFHYKTHANKLKLKHFMETLIRFFAKEAIYQQDGQTYLKHNLESPIIL